MRTSLPRAFVRLSPTVKSTLLRELPRASTLTIIGGTSEWPRVELPDGLRGYITGNSTETLAKPLRSRFVNAPEALTDAAKPIAGIIKTLPTGAVIEVLGMAGAYQYVKDTSGTTGWVRAYNRSLRHR